VRVGDTLGTPFDPDLDPDGTAVTVLEQDQDRHVLIVLADTPEALEAAVDRLLTGEFREDLVGNYVGVGK
jgi:hypothetical protein